MRKKLLLTLFIVTIAITLILSVGTSAGASSLKPSYSTLAREKLSAYDKALYDQLSEDILALKNHNIEQSTVFELDINDLNGAKYTWSQVEINSRPAGTKEGDYIKETFLAQFNTSTVINALLHDMPLETYWYDKTAGSFVSIAYSNSAITAFKVGMSVMSDHQGASWTEEAPTVTDVKDVYDRTYENAMFYVNSFNGTSDYTKLTGYIDVICNLVEYEESVLDPNYDGGYTDVWQVPYVFDEDDLTNVVCEGYAKAFQLLCNLSNFDDATCYTVSGETSGAHMWNIVTIGDNTYIVDVTNSDSGSIGSNGSLTLTAPDSGSYDAGYTFNALSTVTYTYYDWVKNLWGSNILTLANSDYEAPSVEFTLNANTPSSDGFIYDGEAITIGNDNSYDVHYSPSVGIASLYDWSYKCFLDDNGSIGDEMNSSITNVGTYWITVTATSRLNNLETGTTSIKITVVPKTLTINTLALKDKSYDGLNTIGLDSMTLSGVCLSDDVIVDADNSQFRLSNTTVGTYHSCFIDNLVLTGQSANNYTVSYSPSIPVSLSTPVSVTKCNLTTNPPTFEYVTSTTTFSQLDFRVTATWNGNLQSGTLTWYDSDGYEIADSSTTIVRGAEYTWVLVYDNTNFADSTGTVVLYPNETLYSIIATSNNLTQGSASINRQNYIEGETATVTANAKSGYIFDGWYVNGEKVSSSTTYTFTVNSNATIEARFTTSTGSSSDSSSSGIGGILGTIISITPFIPYILIGVTVLGIAIFVLCLVKIFKSSKSK